MLTGRLSAVVVLPALSETVRVARRPAPSPVIVLSAGAPAIPDRSSWADQPTVTSPAYQPSTPGSVVGAPRRVGAVSSTLIPPTVLVASLPAASTARPSSDWSGPSPR